MTLEELGTQLSHSKLQVSELREEACATRSVADASWTSDKEVTHCRACSKEFNLTRRKVSHSKLFVRIEKVRALTCRVGSKRINPLKTNSETCDLTIVFLCVIEEYKITKFFFAKK